VTMGNEILKLVASDTNAQLNY